MDDRKNVTELLPVQADYEALVQKILNSIAFQRSPRQRQLLSFLACEHFAGRSAISEQRIGHHVFGRPSGYSQVEDNIVRVAARQLRARLQLYFEDEGRHEPIVLEIPKGGYRLDFLARFPKQVDLPKHRTAGWWSRLSTMASTSIHWVSALGVGTACLCLGYVLGGSHGWDWIHQRNTAARLPPTAVGALLAGSRRVNVVVADTALIMMQALNGRIPSVDAYSRHAFFAPPARDGDASIPALIQRMSLTSLADVSFLARVLQSDDPVRKRIRVHHARNLNSSDLRDDDTVILGGPRVNPWAGLFESQLNFRFRYEDVGPGCFLNESPQRGEQAQYGDCRLDDAGNYARIAWLPNPSRTGRVLLITGNSMLATESASDFLLEQGSVARLQATLGVTDLARLGSFELLLHVPHEAGAPSGAKLLAMRSHPHTAL